MQNVEGLLELMIVESSIYLWRFQGWPEFEITASHASCNTQTSPNELIMPPSSLLCSTVSHPSQAACRVPRNLWKISMSWCPGATQATHQSCPRLCDFWPQAGGGRRTEDPEGCSHVMLMWNSSVFVGTKTARQLFTWYSWPRLLGCYRCSLYFFYGYLRGSCGFSSLSSPSGFFPVMTPRRPSREPNGRPFLTRPALQGFCGFNPSRLKLGRWEDDCVIISDA